MADYFKALLNLTKKTPNALREFAKKIYAGMNGNPAFTNPPISMADLRSQIDTFADCIVEAMDGSRKAIAERDSQGRVLIRMLNQLAVYVERVSEKDKATFISSGYTPAKETHDQTPPISESIRNIDFGDISGTLKIKAVDVLEADSYELRYAVWKKDGTPGKWTVQPFANTRSYLTIKGLKPGTFYLFQVRALIGTEYTDWSDSVTKICK